MSQASTSRGHVSPTDEAPEASEAPEAREKLVVNSPVDNYPIGPFDTFLLHLYGDHATRHVGEWEVYLFIFALHLF